MPKKTPEDQALNWLEEYESGKRISSIAKDSRKDVRTVEDAIDKARLRRDGRSAHADIVRDVLKNHLTSLLDLVKELRSAVALPSPDLLVRYRKDEEPLSIQLTNYIVTRQEQLPWEVRLSMEDRLEWDLLKEHLKRKPLLQIVEEWKKNLSQHIDARVKLWDRSMSMIAKKTSYPLVEKSGKAPYILYDPTVKFLYDTVLLEKLGVPDGTDAVNSVTIGPDPGEIQICGRVVAYAPGKETELKSSIEKVFKELSNMTPEAIKVANTYKELTDSQISTRRFLDELITFGYIPGRCRLCSQMGI